MGRVFLLLALGIALGYAAGFRDAQRHHEPVYVRLVGGVGGTTQDRVRSDVDRQMDALDR